METLDTKIECEEKNSFDGLKSRLVTAEKEQWIKDKLIEIIKI